MDQDFLHNLSKYKSYRDKSVSASARSLIQLFWEKNPHLLERKDRGKPTEFQRDLILLDYGQSNPKSSLEGAEILQHDIDDQDKQSNDEDDEESDEQNEEGWMDVSHSDDADEEEEEEGEDENSENKVNKFFFGFVLKSIVLLFWNNRWKCQWQKKNVVNEQFP